MDVSTTALARTVGASTIVSIFVLFDVNADADAGPDQELCTTNITTSTMAGSPVIFPASWHMDLGQRDRNDRQRERSEHDGLRSLHRRKHLSMDREQRPLRERTHHRSGEHRRVRREQSMRTPELTRTSVQAADHQHHLRAVPVTFPAMGTYGPW